MSDDIETLMDNIRLCIHQDEEPSWFDYAACERVVADALHKARVGPDGKHLERKRVRLYYADLPQLEGSDEAYRRQCPFCPDGRLLLSRGKDTRIVPNDMCIGCGQRVEYLDVNQIEPPEEATVTIKMTCRRRWVPDFLSMLQYMQYLGNIGSSREVAIYSDGDGDFRPKFDFSEEFETVKPRRTADNGDVMFDAG